MSDGRAPDGAKRDRDFERLFALSADQMVVATLDGRYVRVNPAFTRQLGWEAHEVEGRSLFEHMHPDDHQRTIDEVAALAEGETTLHFENRYLTKAGGVRWLRWTAVPVPEEDRMYAVAHDITAIREAAEEIRASRERLAAVLSSSTSGVMAMEAVRDAAGHVVDFTFTLGNPKSEAMTGLPTEAVLGRRLLDLFPGNEASGQMAMYRRVVETGEPGFMETYYNDGRLDFWLDVSAAKMGENGLAVTFTDVSVRRRAEQERDEAQQARIRDLEASNVHKEQFLGILSHELRTPLNAIEGFGSALEDGIVGPLSPAQADCVGKMLGASQHMLALVNDLLDLSRVQAGRFTIDPHPMDLLAALREALTDLAAPAAAKGVALDADVLAAPRVLADAQRVRQVVANLVGNAIKFTPAGGRIGVSARVDGAVARVEVADTGIGIPAAEQGRIFDAFTQVDMSSTRDGGGIGLGLSIVKSLVEAQGGAVGVASAPGRGSTFWFTLPLAS